MSAYYNECDPFAAAWLRNLISAGLIAPGHVDERSIEDVMLEQWAQRHNISPEALEDLRVIFGCVPTFIPQLDGSSESKVQSSVRLEAARKGVKLWRNNVGVLMDARGVPVRYGLANDSQRLNAACKSGDLIGWRPLLIAPARVGTRVAQFVSRECKRPGWKFKGDAHELAQLKWIEAVVADGGDACFTSGEETL